MKLVSSYTAVDVIVLSDTLVSVMGCGVNVEVTAGKV